MKSLVIIAHPDDEILWFSSVLLRDDAEIVCVTSGRDKNDSIIRTRAFVEAMEMLGIKKYSFLSYPDTSQRLDIKKLKLDLAKFSKKNYDRVFTHSFIGDTHNQKHHQDVSYVVHQLFKNVYSIAWNQYPDMINKLTPEEYHIKKYIIGTLYYREYGLLEDAYEISSVEKFAKFSKESSEIFYYGVANFGDNHEYLSKYKDFWGYKNSPYEIERHEAIVKMVRKTKPKDIIEYGACEGILTKKLSKISPVVCVEKSQSYRKILEEKGFEVYKNKIDKKYDLSVVASFLEYLKNPQAFLRSLCSNKIIIDVILDSDLDYKIKNLMRGKKLVGEEIIRPRWEKMYWDDKKEKLEIYRLGSHIYAYEKK